MDADAAQLPSALIARLPRTWSVFFASHGRFTAVQAAAIPLLLDGKNVVLCAATASGKTEAALAPLIERFSSSRYDGLLVLYLTPTKALVSDLARRLYHPLRRLRWRYAVKTYDRDNFDPKNPARLLITTPESLDALLVSSARILANVQAVILDELHLLDSTPRGDQLRVVLNRLRTVREYAHRVGDAPDATLQYVALSATLAAPEQTTTRYFPDPHVVNIPGSRQIDAELTPLDETGQALHEYFGTFRERGWRKALVFCNSRAEVEQYASMIRSHSPFGDAVYTHYSNFTPERRHEIEEQFAHSEAALCIASSTLELGIDIGSIDVVLLIGAPGNLGSFVQRIGRGGRRKAAISTALFYRNPLEEALFRALLGAAAAAPDRQFPAPFRPSVAVQQIFSMIAASPTGAVRIAELEQRFQGMLDRTDLESIIGTLIQRNYLRAGRPGDYTAGEKLQVLVDRQTSLTPEYSLYSNLAIDNSQIELRDHSSGRQLARVSTAWLSHHEYSLEGRSMQIEWMDENAVWIRPAPKQTLPGRASFISTRPLLAYAVAQSLKLQFGLKSSEMYLTQSGEDWLLWHFLGDLYGWVLFELLRYKVRLQKSELPGLYLTFAERTAIPFSVTIQEVTRYLEENHRQVGSLLQLGAYHRLLPGALQRRAVIEQFNVPLFVAAINETVPVLARDEVYTVLSELFSRH